MTALRLLPELEDALRQIPGVRAASVVTGPDAQPTEIHVLADRAKPAKQVVRDIQSLAMASPTSLPRRSRPHRGRWSTPWSSVPATPRLR